MSNPKNQLPAPWLTTYALREQARVTSTWDLLHDLVFLSRHNATHHTLDVTRIRQSAIWRAEVYRRLTTSPKPARAFTNPRKP